MSLVQVHVSGKASTSQRSRSRLSFSASREQDWRVYSSLASSFITVGKGGAENLLSFAGEDILTGVSLPKKLKIVARYCLVFVLTTFFRIGCITSTTFLVGVGNDGFGVYAYVAQIEFATPLLLAVPLLVLLLLKRLLPMVTIGQLVQGVVGETFTITVWGQSGKEGGDVSNLPWQSTTWWCSIPWFSN